MLTPDSPSPVTTSPPSAPSNPLSVAITGHFGGHQCFAPSFCSCLLYTSHNHLVSTDELKRACVEIVDFAAFMEHDTHDIGHQRRASFMLKIMSSKAQRVSTLYRKDVYKRQPPSRVPWLRAEGSVPRALRPDRRSGMHADDISRRCGRKMCIRDSPLAAFVGSPRVE